MIKWFKNLFKTSDEDRRLAQSIKDLCKTHDVSIHHGVWGGWCVEVKRKNNGKVIKKEK